MERRLEGEEKGESAFPCLAQRFLLLLPPLNPYPILSFSFNPRISITRFEEKPKKPGQPEDYRQVKFDRGRESEQRLSLGRQSNFLLKKTRAATAQIQFFSRRASASEEEGRKGREGPERGFSKPEEEEEEEEEDGGKVFLFSFPFPSVLSLFLPPDLLPYDPPPAFLALY